MRVLCVAEKPSIARSITQILSGGRFDTRNSTNRYIKNFDFDYAFTNSQFTVTSVSGHLLHHDFDDAHRKWQSCDPAALFDANVVDKVHPDSKTIADNLEREARRAQTLMIWTDCDREGENIGAEVMGICRKAKPAIVVKRARFSAIIAAQIHNAAQNPVELDIAQANAVRARIILDLKIGSAFTRLQTLTLQRHFAVLEEVISYGPCQFPTLGFVVSRYNQVKSFIPETFWFIFLAVTRPASDGQQTETVFTWKRGHIFDRNVATVLLQAASSADVARVVKMHTKVTKKWKPLPLTTVELQKAGSRLLRMSPKKVLEVAESLYQRGFLSYPRTETDQFDPQFDFMTLIGKQTVDHAWGQFATTLRDGGFEVPRRGRKDDKAHPPIHPTAHAGNLQGDEKKVYEYITRRFLACCSQDACGVETTVDLDYGGEEFTTSGLRIHERNYLDVYPYDKWTDKELPEFVLAETFRPTVCELREGKTTRPRLLTEADLVSLMDKNGIGTDATIAQHIQTIVDRKYVMERMHGSTKYLVPSTLGIGLIEGYNAIAFDRSPSKPQLRRETERRMVDVCERRKEMADMLQESIEQYREMYNRTKTEFNKVINCVANRLQGNPPTYDDSLDDDDGPNGENDNDNDHHDGPGDGGNGGGGGGRATGRGSRGSKSTRSRGGSAGTGRGTSTSRRGQGRPPPPAPPPPAPPSSRPGRAPSRYTAGDDIDQISDIDDVPAAPAQRPLLIRPPPPAVRPPVSRGTASGSNASLPRPTCHCGLPALVRTVTKDVPNKGKPFWRCGVEDLQCDFFQLQDQTSATTLPLTNSSGNLVIPVKRSLSEQSPSGSSAVVHHCYCNYTAVLKVVAGKNVWQCPVLSDKVRCNYSKVAEGPNQPNSPATRYTGGQASGSKGACHTCGQEGHWAASCPGPGPSVPPPKRTKSTGTVPSGTQCFVCNKEGHWSKDCPDKNKNSLVCFKCNQPGHWANECTGQPMPVASSSKPTKTRRRVSSSRSTSTSTRGSKGTRGKGRRKASGTIKGEDSFD